MNYKFYKCFSLILTICCLSTFTYAQVYVNAAATGTNDGSSWANAYVDLQDALDNAASGSEVWVAAGTYSPGGAVTDFFNVGMPGQAIYGGFAGTETMLSQRDFVANKTILSGDVNEDDVADDFSANRTDNNYHVMWITDTVTNSTIIDGFNIEHGNTVGATGAGNDRRSGGILCYGSPIIRNCIFTQNYGYYAAALYPRGSTADNILVENCTFTRNNGQFGGGVYLVAAGVFNDCIFDNNFASRGAGAYSAGALTTFNNCSFKNSGGSDTRGAGLYGSTSITLNNCIIDLNIGIWGSGIYATDVTNIDSCVFSSNATGEAGGGILCAFQSVVNISNTRFEGNTADRGGAVYAQSDSTIVNIDNCYFFGNSAVGTGGAIYSLAGPLVDVNNSTFDLNGAERGAGIGFASGDGKTVKDRLTISNSKFFDNTSTIQGGALNISNIDSIFITNCLMNDNTANGDGNGGAISFNSSDTLPVYANIMNTTFANNIGALASNIAPWEDTTTAGDLTIVMQNTILHDLFSKNYVIEDGSPTLISNGGNLSSDNTAMAAFTNTNDVNLTDPMFVDAGNRDYRLQYNSPAVNQGLATNGAPMTDINGDVRNGMIDMGAIEYFIAVGTQNPQLENGFDVYPNPVREAITFSLENNWTGDVQFSIVNTLGQVVRDFTMTKNQDKMIEQINLNNLPTGNYVLIARFGNEKVHEIIVKL